MNKKSLICFGGGKNQRKLINISIRKKIETIVIEYKKIKLKNNYIKQVSANSYNLRSIKNKLKDIQKIVGINNLDFIYRSSGPSILSLFYLSKIFNKNRVSKQLAYSIYSKSYFSKLLFQEKLPYINFSVLKKFRPVKKFSKFVAKPDAPIVGKKNVYLIQNNKNFNEKQFKMIINSSHNQKVICSDYINGPSISMFIFKTKNGRVYYYKPVYEINEFKENILEHKEIKECKDKLIIKKIILLSKKILKIFPDYYGFLSISFLCSKQMMFYPYEINIGLSGDNMAEKHLSNLGIKKNPFEMEIKNLIE